MIINYIALGIALATLGVLVLYFLGFLAGNIALPIALLGVTISNVIGIQQDFKNGKNKNALFKTGFIVVLLAFIAMAYTQGVM